MPQLQPGDFAPQLIWLAITFALLYFGLSRIALPRVAQIIGERKSRINGDLEHARRAQAEAESAMKGYEASLASAKAKGQGLIRAAREKLDAELGARRSELDRQIAGRARDTEARVKAMTQRAAKEMEGVTASVVQDIVHHLTGLDASEIEIKAALAQPLRK